MLLSNNAESINASDTTIHGWYCNNGGPSGVAGAI